MNDDIKPELDLFTRFREVTGGDAMAASYLTLAYMMQDRRKPATEKPARRPPEQLLSMKEAAEYLGCTIAEMRKQVARAWDAHTGRYVEGPTLDFFQSTKGSPIRFKREWLDAFKQQQAAESKVHPPKPEEIDP